MFLHGASQSCAASPMAHGASLVRRARAWASTSVFQPPGALSAAAAGAAHAAASPPSPWGAPITTCRATSCHARSHGLPAAPGPSVTPPHGLARLPPPASRSVRQRAFSGGGAPFGAGGPGDVYMNLFSSSLFRNSHVVQDFNEMVTALMSLSRMGSSFPDMDVVGKRLYLEQLRAASERYQLWIKRLELSDDPAAKEYLRFTNAQMLNGGFTLQSMFAGLEISLKQYESWVGMEEVAIARGPQAHMEFLKEMRAAWRQTALGAMDTASLSGMDPMILTRAQTDPQFWTMVREVSEAPTPEVFNRWMEQSSDALRPLVAELAKNVLQQQFKRQGL